MMLEPVKRKDGWWISNTPAGIDEMGPYSDDKEGKAEMKDDIRGCKVFCKDMGIKLEGRKDERAA